MVAPGERIAHSDVDERPDGSRQAPDSHPHFGRSLVFAGIVLTGAALAVGLRAPSGGPVAEALNSEVDVLSGAVAVLVGVLTIARYRWIGDVAALWIGAGMLALGTSRLAYRVLFPLIGPDLLTAQTQGITRLGGRAVALVALVTALTRPIGDTRPQVRRLLAVAASTLIAVVIMSTLPSLFSDLFVDDVDLTLTSRAHFVVASFLGLTWVLIAAVYLRKGFREDRSLLAWFGLSFLVLGIAQFLSLPATLIPELPVLSAHVLRTAGYVCAFVGVLYEMRHLYRGQRAALSASARTAEHLAARVRSERDAYEEHIHESRNALAVIEVATNSLRHHRDALSPEDRQRLDDAAVSGVQRLGQLLDADASRSRSTFRLATVIDPLVAASRADGDDVRVEIDEHLEVTGAPAETSQILHNLLVNARRHAAGSPVSITTRREGDRIVVLVEDRGPGVSDAERAAIFERGVRGASARAGEGSGLGLWVSRELVKGLGGDIWVDDRLGGGASFAFSLPIAPREAQTD